MTEKEINVLDLYCTYSKSKVYNEGSSKLYDIIDTIDIGAKCLGLRNLGDEAPTFHVAINCKLALKPLSTLTEEHAILCARLVGKKGNDDYLIHHGQMQAYVHQNRKAIDKLRLLGYDVGYLKIPSLIKDGRYAVDINKIQK